MHNIREKFPRQFDHVPLHTVPPEKQVRLKLNRLLEEGRREYTAHAYDERLPIYDECAARLTMTEMDVLSDAIKLVELL